jgi:hypothetical protein
MRDGRPEAHCNMKQSVFYNETVALNSYIESDAEYIAVLHGILFTDEIQLPVFLTAVSAPNVFRSVKKKHSAAIKP